MTFSIKYIALPVLMLTAASAPGFAQTVQSSLTLTLAGDAEQHGIAYDCGEFGQLSVIYINAAPNFLALVPHENTTIIFAGVIAASGVRYASGIYEWWTKGTEATFRDLTAAEDAPPLATCSEITNTP